MTLYSWTQRIVWIGFGLFAAAFLLLGAWDIVLIAKGRLAGNSASRVILEIARTAPIFVFVIGLVLGVLVGHFSWPQWRAK